MILNNSVSLNISRSQKQALKDLKSRSDLMVTLTDKNLGLALITKEDYYNRITTEMDRSPQAFRYLDRTIDTHQEIQFHTIQSIVDILKYISKDERIPRICEFIRRPIANNNFKLCKAFGLPKLHKPGKRMRMIFPMSSHPFGPAHQFIASCLNHFVLQYESVIYHVLEVVDQVINKELDGNLIIFKADIATFYPSANMDLVKEVIRDIMDRSWDLQQFLGSTEGFIRIIELAHMDLEFMVNSRMYCQDSGVPIGSPCGPPLAILALHHTIQSYLSDFKSSLGLIYFGIYFDDIFGIGFSPAEIIKSELTQLIQRSQCFNLDEESFEFSTIEDLSTTPLPFLDIEIYSSRQPSGQYRLLCRPYCKVIGAYQYVPWRSAHPPAVKRSIIIGEFCRRLRLCSTLDDWKNTKVDLFKKLRSRGYPPWILEQAQDKFEWDESHLRRVTTIQKLKDKRNASFPWSFFPLYRPPKFVAPIIIRYDPRIHSCIKESRRFMQEEVDKVIHRLSLNLQPRIIIAFKMGRKLLSILQYPVHPTP